MPIGTSLNLSPVGIHRKRTGNSQGFAPRVDIPSLGDMQPVTDMMQPIGSPSFVAQAPTPTIKTGEDEDGKSNWFAMLAPLISAGLGYAIGGKAGAAVGFSGGAQGGANFVTERERIRKVASDKEQQGIENTQKEEQIGIQRTESETRSEAEKNVTADRAARLNQKKIERAVATGMMGGLSPEDRAEATKLFQQKRKDELAEDIGKVSQPSELDSYVNRIDGYVIAGDIAKEDAPTLKSQALGRKKDLEDKRTERTEEHEGRMAAIGSANAYRDAEIERKRLAQIEAGQKDRENTLTHITRQVGAGMSFNTIQKTYPNFTREEYNELKGESEGNKIFEMTYHNEMVAQKTPEQAMATAQKQKDATIAKYMGASGATGFDQAKVAQGAEKLKGIPESQRKETLEAMKSFTEQEKAEIAKLLGLSWGTTVKPVSVGSYTIIDNEIDNLPK